jgi:hypothetical protein
MKETTSPGSSALYLPAEGKGGELHSFLLKVLVDQLS